MPDEHKWKDKRHVSLHVSQQEQIAARFHEKQLWIISHTNLYILDEPSTSPTGNLYINGRQSCHLWLNTTIRQHLPINVIISHYDIICRLARFFINITTNPAINRKFDGLETESRGKSICSNSFQSLDIQDRKEYFVSRGI